jgi:hypothetical protein
MPDPFDEIRPERLFLERLGFFPLEPALAARFGGVVEQTKKNQKS